MRRVQLVPVEDELREQEVRVAFEVNRESLVLHIGSAKPFEFFDRILVDHTVTLENGYFRHMFTPVVVIAAAVGSTLELSGASGTRFSHVEVAKLTGDRCFP